MRKMALILVLAALAAGAFHMTTASADHTCTVPIGLYGEGCVTVNEGGYVLIVDGGAGNVDPPGPHLFFGPRGFISVSSGGGACMDDNGTADDGDPGNGLESTSPTCFGPL